LNKKEINGKVYQWVDGELFDENFEFIHKEGADFFVYEFGGHWYYTPAGKTEMNPFKYIDNKPERETEAVLGYHSPYELLHSAADIKTTIQKAKFIGAKAVAITDVMTLSGTLKFQKECLANDIKPILGATLKFDGKKQVKVLVKNEIGWINLSHLNSQADITTEDLIERSEGLIYILNVHTLNYDNIIHLDLNVGQLFYQFDVVTKYINTDRQIEYFKRLKEFTDRGEIEPVLVNDVYYLDEQDSFIMERLQQMSKDYDYKKVGQYMVTDEEAYSAYNKFFNNNNIWDRSVTNRSLIVKECNYKVDTETKHLPEYILTEEEKAKYGDALTMFRQLIVEGINKKYGGVRSKELMDRIEKEYKTLMTGELYHYFLNTRDIVNGAMDKGVTHGLSRGSAGGSVISYLLDITEIDPLKYNLLFERFLNKGRLPKIV